MASNRLDEQDPFSAFFAAGEDDENEPSAMWLVDHLEELRWRIFKSLIAITIGTIIAFVFRGYIVHFLELPLPQTADSLTHGKPIVTGITEGFTVFLLISIAAGWCGLTTIPILLIEGSVIPWPSPGRPPVVHQSFFFR